ncbi:hypothetical protein [Rhizobium sp. CF142]|uniref:hypothetical protein n=1 Tax=Rhizobium sp. CF142 TaxID=1144314 RepID=UPI00026F02DD|nr:hypothetical protein [Rhizobium sp. CF142]EJJ27324.1 hypothetical protein PMI11_04338 [Rhizobium sp. CF142]
MSDVTEGDGTKTEPYKAISPEILYSRYFLIGGLVFLCCSLALFASAAWLAIQTNQQLPSFVMAAINQSGSESVTTNDRMLNVLASVGGVFMAPLLCLIAGFMCSFLGIRLLKTSGAAATHVIAPQDYGLLGPAIAGGNSSAIDQFIRLSSLSGATGTFTKVGLTGLPLATIVLTLILAILGIFNAQFFDLAKLTLGAFLGSFVQRQAEVAAAKPPA